MVAGNVPLQQRAGRNIGIENLPVFIQAAGAPEIEVPLTNAATTLLEAVENAVRTPFTRGEKNGYLFSTESADSVYSVYFRDSLGNEMLIATGLLSANSSDFLDLSVDDSNVNPFTPNKPLCLCDGEKIIIRAAPAT